MSKNCEKALIGNGKNSKIINELQSSFTLIARRVLSDPDTSYLSANDAFNKISVLPSIKTIDQWSAYQDIIKEVIEQYEKAVHTLMTSNDPEDHKKAVGFATFIGLLYKKNLVSESIISNWTNCILKHDIHDFFQSNLLVVIKDKVKSLIESGCFERSTIYLNKAIIDGRLYEEEDQAIVRATKQQINEFNHRRRKP